MDMTAQVAELRGFVSDGRLSRAEYEQSLYRLLNECEAPGLQTYESAEADRQTIRRQAFLFGSNKRFWS